MIAVWVLEPIRAIATPASKIVLPHRADALQFRQLASNFRNTDANCHPCCPVTLKISMTLKEQLTAPL